MRTAPLAILLVSCHGPVPPAEDLLMQHWAAAPRLEERLHDPTREAPPPGAIAEPERGAAWSLEQILERIRRANPDLATARARVVAAEALRAEAFSYYYPSFTASQGYLSTDNPATAFGLLLNQQRLTLGPGFDPTPGSIDNWHTELRLDVQLFSPGRHARYSAAEAGARSAELLREAAERRLLNAGVQAWLGLRAAVALRRVKERTIAVVEERLEQTVIREREGAALPADVLRLEVRLGAARQNQQQAELAVRQAESQLQALMGLHGDQRIRLAEEQHAIGRDLPTDLQAAIARARSSRLDARAEAESLRSHEYSRNAAEAGRLPRLLAFGSYFIDGQDLSFDTDLDSYMAGVGLEWSLSGQTGPRIRRARAELDIARSRLRALATRISREVADALAALDVAARSDDLARLAAASAEEASRIVSAAQDAGGATVTDVLEAENARDDAAARAVVAAAALDIARARLAAAMGEVR